MRLIPILACLCLALSSCTVAPPPEQQSAAARKAAEHHELRDAIQKPMDRAKSANDPNVEADKAKEQAIEDAGG
jgi:hypothetical protein